MDARDAAGRAADVFRGIRAAMLHPVGVDFHPCVLLVQLLHQQIHRADAAGRGEFMAVVMVADLDAAADELLGDVVVADDEVLPQLARPLLLREEAADGRVFAVHLLMTLDHGFRAVFHRVNGNVRHAALQTSVVQDLLHFIAGQFHDAGQLDAVITHLLHALAGLRQIDGGLAVVAQRVHLCSQ